MTITCLLTTLNRFENNLSLLIFIKIYFAWNKFSIKIVEFSNFIIFFLRNLCKINKVTEESPSPKPDVGYMNAQRNKLIRLIAIGT